MPAPLYFAANRSATNDQLRAARPYAIGERVAKAAVTGAGPSGAAGLLFADPERLEPQHLAYRPDVQRWRRDPSQPADGPAGEIWVGVYTDHRRPTPEELARSPLIPGPRLVLPDSHVWTIPKARQYEQHPDHGLLCYCPLPKRLTLDDAGEWVSGEVIPRFRKLWELAAAYAEAEELAAAEAPPDADTVVFTFDGLNDLAVAALAVNYHVGPVEIDLLDIFDVETRTRLIDTVLDRETWRRLLQKKTDQAA